MSKQDQQHNGEEEEGDGAQAFLPHTGPDRDQMAANYLPEGEDWLAKTILDINDPHAVAALLQFDEMFPEVDDLQPILNEFTSDFMKGRTSVNAKSREEYENIIRAMFGDSGDDSAAATVGKFLAGDLDED